VFKKEIIMIRSLSIFFLALFLTNCSTKHLSPVNVSDYFWAAQQEKKLEDAKKFVREDDKKNVALQKSIHIKRFSFSDAKVDGDEAVVPTTMYLEGMFSKKRKDEVEIAFNTYLQETKDGWKVNVKETKKALYIETAKKFTKGLGAGIFSEIKEKMGDFKEFQSIFEEMINGMKKSLGK
jgi:hypothetical protein